jgi:hypothetical protein
MTRRLPLSLGLIAALLFAGEGAHAQSAESKTDAQAAFDLGKKLMLEGKFVDACPKFADSLRLDPGVGTMLFLADCYEKVGRNASAWAEFREAQGLAARQFDGREVVARDRADALEPKLSKLIIVVPPEQASLPLFKVMRDGAEVGQALWGAAVPVDPGPHQISATAAKKKEWSTKVSIAAGAPQSSVSVPELLDAPIEIVAAPPPSRAIDDASPPESGKGGDKQRLVGIGVAALGVVGIAVGSVFGLEAIARKSESNDHCHDGNHCDQTGVDSRSAASTDATISTVTFGLGIAALAGGAVLYFTAPHARKSGAGLIHKLTPSVGRGGGGLTFRASF